MSGKSLKGQGIVLFHNSSSAMRSEAVLKKAGMKVRLVPTPRDLSSDCGVSLSFPWELKEEVVSLLEKARVATQGVFEAPE